MDLTLKALNRAYEKHYKKKRKVTGIPYYWHPNQVGMLLMRYGYGENLICAGFLHDTVEDTDYTIEEIAKDFNPEIARLVKAVTAQDRGSWRATREYTIEYMSSAPQDERIVSCADKLANLEDMIRDYKHIEEDKLWQSFNASKEDITWYYQSMVESFKAGNNNIADEEIFKRYERKVDYFFNKLLSS